MNNSSSNRECQLYLANKSIDVEFYHCIHSIFYLKFSLNINKYKSINFSRTSSGKFKNANENNIYFLLYNYFSQSVRHISDNYSDISC